jgi:hypothetical protein
MILSRPPEATGRDCDRSNRISLVTNSTVFGYSRRIVSTSSTVRITFFASGRSSLYFSIDDSSIVVNLKVVGFASMSVDDGDPSGDEVISRPIHREVLDSTALVNRQTSLPPKRIGLARGRSLETVAARGSSCAV